MRKLLRPAYGIRRCLGTQWLTLNRTPRSRRKLRGFPKDISDQPLSLGLANGRPSPPLRLRHAFPGFCADDSPFGSLCLARRPAVSLCHPLWWASPALTPAPGEALQNQKCVFDLAPFGAEVRQHLQNVHRCPARVSNIYYAEGRDSMANRMPAGRDPIHAVELR